MIGVNIVMRKEKFKERKKEVGERLREKIGCERKACDSGKRGWGGVSIPPPHFNTATLSVTARLVIATTTNTTSTSTLTNQNHDYQNYNHLNYTTSDIYRNINCLYHSSS